MNKGWSMQELTIDDAYYRELLNSSNKYQIIHNRILEYHLI